LNHADKQRIINAETPKIASQIGRDRGIAIQDNWKNIKIGVMYTGVYEKFRQNPEILKKLLATGDEEIVEETVDEYFWGCGKDRNGQNHFGIILGQMRTALRENAKDSTLS
jgi:ribA/ribD-fused uncharacterized protein